MKKTYNTPEMEIVGLNISQPMLTMSISNTETDIQFAPPSDEIFPDIYNFEGLKMP